MKNGLLDILACPECGGRLTYLDLEEQDCLDVLSCIKCDVDYPIEGNIPRFVASDSYVSSFSREWSLHARTQLDSFSGLTIAETQFFTRTGLKPVELKDKLILDAGCGIGRYSEIAAKYGGRVIGLDLSYSVEQAYENVGHKPHVDIVQGDIFRLPFKPDTFDIVFSLGVIHHTPSAEKAFGSLARVVKPGGKLAVWVYGNDGFMRKGYNAIAAFYRTFSTRIPEETLYRMCKIAVPLYHVHKALRFTEALLPISMEPRPEWRILDTFDWYSPKYQSKHSYKQVESWFNSGTFRNVRRLTTPTSMVGEKV